ncbi:MAG: hypothetical protein HY587_05275 [Candidatus Omnitrophica bacterium]|nr:hypothetical protein [Candidatus Omnitrophota bacterium]
MIPAIIALVSSLLSSTSIAFAAVVDDRCRLSPDFCPPPPPPPPPELALTFYVDSVSPFTNFRRIAPSSITVPRNVEIKFYVTSNVAVQDFKWSGAAEISEATSSSIAYASYPPRIRELVQLSGIVDSDEGLASSTSSLTNSYTVTVTPYVTASDGTIQPKSDKAKSITVLMTTDNALSVQMMITDPTDVPTAGSTKKQWNCHAVSVPAGYEGLIQWAGGGLPDSGLGPEFNTRYPTQGFYTLKAGPTSTIQFQIYDVNIRWDSAFGQTVWYGYPITFTATTNPPGFEQNVSWRVETMNDVHTHAEFAPFLCPVFPCPGPRGSSATITFTNPPNDNLFWAQVYADDVGAFRNTDPGAPNVSTRTIADRQSEDELCTDNEECGGGGVQQEDRQNPAVANDGDLADDIFLNSGELYHSVSDLFIPGRGLAYQFVRTYKSQIAYSGIMGRNWDHNYNMRLIRDRNQFNQLTGHMSLISGLSRSDLYLRQGDGSFVSPTGFYTKLVENPDSSFTLRERNGTRYHFLPLSPTIDRLFLTAITNRNGNQIGFTYDSRGLLRTVRDTLSRIITYSYDAKDLLRSVADFRGRAVTFTYDQNDNLISVTSPAVIGTPNGNDFPQGKTTKYTYSSGFADSRLNFNLLTITRPNEAALDPDGPPVLINTYGTDLSGRPYEYDKVLTQVFGGTHETGVPAGGTFTYFYEQLNPGAAPPDLTIPRNRTTLVDRVGNVAEYEQNVLGNHLRYREYTGRVNPNLPRATLETLIPSRNPSFPPIGKLRASDPNFFDILYEYNEDGERIRITYPEGNNAEFVYDVGNVNRFAHGNVLEVRRVADAGRGGNGSGSAINNIVSKLVYEPVFNQLRFASDPRGLDPAFVPPVNPTDSGIAGIDFDGSGIVTADEIRRARYTSVNTFDYQETSAADIQALADAEGAVLDPGEAGFLSLNSDVNGDAITNQTQGNLIRVQAPLVQLASGGTQPITSLFGYNSRGQMLNRIDPDGSRDEFAYYPESNPHGFGGIPADADTVLELGGYLGRVIRDTTAADNSDGVALNITTDYRYDPVGNVISVLDGRGILTRFEVNLLNQVVRATRAADVSASSEPGLTAFAYQTTYFYDANENLIRVDVENRDGDTDSNTLLTTTSSYDILDRVLESTSEVSPTKTLTTRCRYDANENLIRVIEPLGNFHDTVYDERDLAFKTIGGADDALIASTVTYNYDKNRNVKSVLDSEDNNGDTAPEETLLFYDGFDRLLEILDPVGNETISVYDPAGNVILGTARGVIGGPSPATNNAAGNTDLSRGSAQYDELNRVIRTDGEWFISAGVNPVRAPLLGDGFNTSLVEYDEMSRVIRAVNDNGHAAVFEYDGLSRSIHSVDALQNEATVVYDANSNVTHLTSIERRGDDLLAAPETFVTVNRYDALNRLRFTSDNLDQSRRLVYDSRNNVTQISDAQGPVDLNDPEIGLTNRSGNTRRFFYDGINRRLKVIEDLRVGGVGNGSPSLDGPADPNLDPAGLDTTNSANPDGKIMETNIWDDNSRLLSVSDDKGNTTRYAYDSLNRKILDTFADGTTNTYVYDRDSNFVQLTDENGSVFSYDHDGINRVIRVDIARAAGIGGTTVQTLEYDGLSRLTRVTDNNDPVSAADDSELTFLYDSLSRRIEEIQDGEAITSDYDGLGNRIQLTYPNGREVSAEFDALERLKTINDLRLSEPNNDIAVYSYIGAGRILERTLLNGTKLTYLDNAGNDVGYDGVKRIVKQRHEFANDVHIADFTYGYNRENMRLFERRLHELTGPEFKGEAYGYDSLYRLMNFEVGPQAGDGTISTPETETAYNLDGVGNRTMTLTDTVPTPYVPNIMNEYDVVGGVPNPHDDNGNLKDDGAYLYTHDALNRLIRVNRKSDNAPIATYTYDALNRRTAKTVSNSGSLNGTTRFFWDGWRELEEHGGTGTVTAQYVKGRSLDELLTMERGGNTYYFYENALGSIVAANIAGGGTEQRYTYDAFGAPTFAVPDTVGNPFLFTGRYFDAETGLYYYRNRYYQPKTGRFIERDPMGYAAGSLSLYEYVGSNSINFTDPMGWSPQGSGAGVPFHEEQVSWWELGYTSLRIQGVPQEIPTARGRLGRPVRLFFYEYSNSYWDSSPQNTLTAVGDRIGYLWVDRHGNPSGLVVIGMHWVPLADVLQEARHGRTNEWLEWAQQLKYGDFWTPGDVATSLLYASAAASSFGISENFYDVPADEATEWAVWSARIGAAPLAGYLAASALPAVVSGAIIVGDEIIFAGLATGYIGRLVALRVMGEIMVRPVLYATLGFLARFVKGWVDKAPPTESGDLAEWFGSLFGNLVDLIAKTPTPLPAPPRDPLDTPFF